MATWYTDVATAQQLGNNFPGDLGMAQIVNPPSVFENVLLQGPNYIVATYTWNGNEAANDVINVALLQAGVMVDPNGKVASGLKSPSSTLTFAIGDNDLAIPSLLPIVNGAAVQTAAASQSQTAPEWVSGKSYVPGNVVTDSNSTPAALTYMCVAATSAATAPHSAANTVWMPNNQRYSNSIDCSAASGNVAFAGGTQQYGGPPSFLPNSVLPGTSAGLTGGSALNKPYQIQGDCWLQALILTINTSAINANAVSVFRVALNAAN